MGPRPELETPEQKAEFEKRFKKSSLAWLMGLARVEIGATVAMYGISLMPFDDLAPRGFGESEYVQFLLDDAAAHLNALDTDSVRRSRYEKGQGEQWYGQ